MRRSIVGLVVLISLTASVASSVAAGRPRVALLEEASAPTLAFTGTAWRAYQPTIQEWLVKSNPGLAAEDPGVPILAEMLARWSSPDKTGKVRMSAKYGSVFITRFNAYQQVAEAVDASVLPEPCRKAWLLTYAEQMVGNRLALDVEAIVKQVQQVPAGGTGVMPEAGRPFSEVLGKTYSDWAGLSGPELLRRMTAIAAVNPGLRPSGFYRLAPGAQVKEDWPHAAVNLADGRIQVQLWRALPGRAVYLPPAAWLGKAPAVPVPAEETAAVRGVQVYRFRVPAAVDGLDLVVQLSLTAEGVFDSGVLMAPALCNRAWSVYPFDPTVGQGVNAELANLTRKDGRLSGAVHAMFKPGRGETLLCTLALDLDASTLDGTCRITVGDKALGGGKTSREPDPAPQVFAPGKAWPLWLGAGGDARAQDGAGPLVEDLEDARLAWASDDNLSDGRGQDTRGKAVSIPLGRPLSGTYFTPVVSEGKLVVTAYEPSGKAYSYGAGEKGDPEHYRINRILADDVVQCFDATTGRTLWKRVYPERGLNWAGFNKGGPKLSAAISGSIVVAVGTLGQVYALDLNTGATVWESDIGPRYDVMQVERKRLLAEGILFSTRNDFMFDPMIVDGVVVVPDARRSKMDYRYEVHDGIIGLDLATGKQLWSLPELGFGSRFYNGVQICRLGEKNYVLGAGGGELRLIDPKTGTLVWRVPGVEMRNEYLGICNNIVLAEGAQEGEGPAGIVGVRISPTRGEIIWRLPPEYKAREGGAVAVGGNFYVQLEYPSKQLYCVDSQTGKVLASVPLNFCGGEHCPFIVAMDGRLVSCSDRTGGYYLIDADPGRMADSVRFWSGLGSGMGLATGYCGPILPALVDGRMFVRVSDHVLCYDLRQASAVKREASAQWLDSRTGIKPSANAPSAKSESDETPPALEANPKAEAKPKSAPDAAKAPADPKRAPKPAPKPRDADPVSVTPGGGLNLAD